MKQKNTKKVVTKTDFSDFFYNASEEEQKKLFSKVLKAANRDQQELVARYEKLYGKDKQPT